MKFWKSNSVSSRRLEVRVELLYRICVSPGSCWRVENPVDSVENRLEFWNLIFNARWRWLSFLPRVFEPSEALIDVKRSWKHEWPLTIWLRRDFELRRSEPKYTDISLGIFVQIERNVYGNASTVVDEKRSAGSTDEFACLFHSISTCSPIALISVDRV